MRRFVRGEDHDISTMLCDLRGIVVAASTQRLLDVDQVMYRATERIDIASTTNEESQMIGVVRMFKPAGGYGFLRAADSDVFVHISATPGFSELAVGQRCSFEIGTNSHNGRECAVDVKLLEPVISQPATPRAFRAKSDDLDEATAHMQLASKHFCGRVVVMMTILASNSTSLTGGRTRQ